MLTTSESDVPINRKKRFPVDAGSEAPYPQWAEQNDFVACVCGYIVCYGNLMYFPLECYRYGGGLVMVTYSISLIGIGLPLLLLEFTIGQLTGGMVENYWFCPLFRGLDYFCFLINLLITYYYVFHVSTAFLYLTYSFQTPIPWENCHQPWATKMCADYIKNVDRVNCTGNITSFGNGTCYDMNDGTLYGIYNKTLAEANGIIRHLPAQDFLNYESLKTGKSKGLHDLGPLQWRICVCLAVVWVLTFCGLIKGITRAAKVFYYFLLVSLIVIIILIINSFTMHGSGRGLSLLFRMDMSDLAHHRIWLESATHMIFSVGLLRRCLPALASFNKFQFNIVKDAFIVACVDAGYSFLATIAVFSCIGAFAEQWKTDLQTILQKSHSLAFSVYPQALSMLPMPLFWSVVFFLMLVCVGYTTILVMVETLTLDTMRIFGIASRFRLVVLAGIAFILYLAELCMATPGGIYIFFLVKYHSINLSVLVVVFLSTVAVVIYGPKRFCDDIEMMVGTRPVFRIPWKYLRWYFIICWSGYIPFSMLAHLAISIYRIKRYKLKVYAYTYSLTVEIIGRIGEVLMLTTILIPIFWDVSKSKGPILRRFYNLLQAHPRFCRLTTEYSTATMGLDTVESFGRPFIEGRDSLHRTSFVVQDESREDVDDDGLDDLAKGAYKQRDDANIEDMAFCLIEKNPNDPKKLRPSKLKPTETSDSYRKISKRRKRRALKTRTKTESSENSITK